MLKLIKKKLKNIIIIVMMKLKMLKSYLKMNQHMLVKVWQTIKSKILSKIKCLVHLMMNMVGLTKTIKNIQIILTLIMMRKSLKIFHHLWQNMVKTKNGLHRKMGKNSLTNTNNVLVVNHSELELLKD